MLLPWREISIEGGFPIGTSLTQDESQRLRDLSYRKRVLEVGSAYGYSSVLMATGNAKSVLAVDPHGGRLHGAPGIHDSLAVMRRNLAAYDVEHKVSIVLAPSQVVLPTLYDAGAWFDLVFIDGDHSEHAVRNDFEFAMGLVGSNGKIAFHDYGEETCPDVQRVLDAQPVTRSELVDTLWIGS